MNKRMIRLAAVAVVLAATVLGSLQLSAGPRRGPGGDKWAECVAGCSAGGGGLGSCMRMCAR